MGKIFIHSLVFFLLLLGQKAYACGPIPPTVIDSVSTDPITGNIIVSWIQNPSPHTHYYVVYVYNPLSDPPWDAVDTVYGATNLSTIVSGFNTSGGNYIVAVSAVDSCGNPSFFSFETAHNTMQLLIDYDPCSLSATISWQSYRNWPNGVQAYRVWASEQGGAYKLIGTTGGDTTFAHNNLNPLSTVCYVVQAINGSATKSASSNRRCITADFPAVPVFSYLRFASVKSNNSVDLAFYLDITADVNHYLVERRTNNKWETLDTIAPNKLIGNNLAYTDQTANTSSNSYYYRLRTINTCEKESAVSNIARTILLDAKNLQGEMANLLKWNEYEGFENGNVQYRIHRSINSDLSFVNTDAINAPANRYTDDISEYYTQTGEFCYFVQAVEAPGNGFGFTDLSRSNVVCVEQLPLVYVPNAFSPNGDGLNEVFAPVFSFLEPSNYSLSVYNRWGQLIFNTRDIYQGWDGNSSEGQAPSGVYVYLLEYRSVFGQEYSEKGMVSLLR